MRGTAGLAVVVLLAALTGCSDGGGGSQGASPEPQPSASEPSASGLDRSEVKELLHAGLGPLVDGSVIDFRHDVYSGAALAIETRGRAFQGLGWQATTTSPKELGSPDAPHGEEVKGSMQVRAVDADLYMQLSSWQGPLAGCWLRTTSGQVPGGQLGMLPGVPGYVTLLGALKPREVVSQDADKTVIGAEVPLRVGLQLLTTGVLGLLQLEASQLDGASVPIGVKLTDGVVTDVELLGTDLLEAVRAAGGDVAPDAEVTLRDLHTSVGYRAGPADAPRVTAPAADLVMTSADVDSGRGC